MNEPAPPQSPVADSPEPVPARPSAPPPGGPYEPCAECGAPLDPQQRYCVNCAARRPNGANPSSRYFAAVSRSSRRGGRRGVRPPTSPGGRAAAVAFFALLPVAVAIGVLVGRGSAGDEEALLEALRQQRAGVAGIASGAAGGEVAATGKAGKGAKRGGRSGEGKVVAKTKYGEAHQVTNFKPSEEKVQEDTAVVNEIAQKKGQDYIKTQRHLPDVIVIGGDPSKAPPLPTGAQP